MVVYENGAVPKRIERQGYDANIAVATTRAFLRIAEEVQLVPSAAEIWKRIASCTPTPNALDRVFQQRRTPATR
jgi:hypothetical protein